MKNCTKSILSFSLAIFFLFCLTANQRANAQSTSWKGTGTTTWGTATNWTNGVPTATVNAIIGDAAMTGAINPNISTTSNCLSLTVGGKAGSTLTITRALTVWGNLSITAGGTIAHKGYTLNVKGNWSNSGTYTTTTGSLTNFAGATQTISGPLQTAFRKLTINAGSTTSLQINTSVSGAFKVIGTFIPVENAVPYVVSGTGTLTVSPTGILKITAPTFIESYSLSGAKTYNNGNTIEYSAAAINQTVSNAITYSNLKISGGLIKTLAGNLTALHSSTASFGNIYVNAGTLDLATFTANRATVSAGGVLSVSNGAKLRIGGSNTFPTGYATIALSLSSITEYYGGATQVVAAQTYGELLLTSTSGIATKTMPSVDFTVSGNLTSAIGTGTAVNYTAASNITVDGTLNVGASTTFNGGTFNHRLTGNTINLGTITGNTSTFLLAGSGTSLSGNGVYNFNNLTVSASGNTIAATTNINIQGNLSTTLSGTLTHSIGTGSITMSGTTKTITGTGINFSNLSCTGSISTTSSFVVSGNLTVGGSLMASTGSLTLSGTTKTISGAGVISLASLAVPGTITTASNFTINTFLDVSGSFVATTPSTATFTGTSTLNGTANLFNATINGTSLQLATGSVLGIANTFTITAGTFNVTSSTPNTLNYNGTTAQNILSTTYHHLDITNASTKTAANALTVNGNFTIGTGATFVPGNFTHTYNGNWTNSGSFTAGTSTIAMRGSANTTITGTAVFNNLTLNKTAGSALVTLANNITAATVTMTAGTLSTGINTLNITNTRSGNGIILGNIQRTHAFTTGIDYAFEGPNNHIRFSAVTGVTSITVKVTKGAVADYPFGGSISRVYDVVVPAGTYTAKLRLHYEDAELNGNAEATQQLWNYNVTAWQLTGKDSNNTSINFVEKSGLTSIAKRWTLSDDANVVRWNGSVSTDWATAGNWTAVQGSPSLPPGANDIAEIGKVTFTNQPTISVATTVKSILFGSVKAATVTMNTAGSFSASIGNISGSWSANANHTFNVNNKTLNIGGDLTLSDGIADHTINLGISTGTVNLTGTLTQSGNANITFAGSGALNIGTDYNYTSGTVTPSTGTITYNGTDNQNVAGVTYHHLTINKTDGIATLISPQTINGNLLLVAGEFDNAANTVLAGNLTINSGATLNNLSTFRIGGNWVNNGSYLGQNSTAYFEGTGSQTLNATTFNNLIVNKPSGSLTLTGNINLEGNLTVSSGSVDVQNFTVTRNTAGGQFTLSAGASMLVGGLSNWPSNFTAYSLDAASTFTYNGTLAQNVAGITYGNLVLSNGSSNAKTLAASAIVNGNLTINTGASFNASSFSIDLFGNWNNSGTFLPGTGTVLLNGTSKTVNGNTTFYRMAVYGSYTAMGSDYVFNSTLRIVTGGSYGGGSGTTTLYGDLTNNGSLTSNGVTNFMGTSVQTLRLVNALVSNSSGVINFNGTVSPVLNSTSAPIFATLNINNTGGINPSVDWSVFVAMNINAGGIFNGGSSTHTIYGGFTNNGTVTSSGSLVFSPSTPQTYKLAGSAFTSTGTVVFNGSAAIAATGTPTLQDVIISNTAGVTPASGWTIGGDFAITGAGIFNAGNFSYTVAGDIESGGTLNEGTSTFTMTSPTGQISGSSNTTFYDFVVNAAASISINSDFNIARNLTNNNVLDASIGSPIFVGNTPGTIGGSPTEFALAQFDVEKNVGVTLTLAKNINTVSLINVNSGILNVTASTIAQDLTVGNLTTLTVAENATLKLTGPTALPAFDDYYLDSLSTVEFAGAAQEITSVSGFAKTYGNLIISTAGNKTANGPLNIRNNFTLSNGTFVPGNHTDTLGGNWLMSNGTYTTGTSRVVLNGTGAQSISSTGSFFNITVNKTAGSTTLASNITLAGTLTFTNGKISTGSNTLIISSTGTITGAAQGTGWVFGKLQKPVPTGATSRTFEVGGNLNYSPATVAFASVTTAGNLVVNATATDHPSIATSGFNALKSVNRYFTITNSGTVFSAAGATVTLNFVAGDIDGGAAFANFKVKNYIGAAWNTLTTANPTATTIQATSVNTFGDFAMGELSVTATTWNGSVSTDWNAASNWSSGVPTTSLAVTIPASMPRYPVLTSGTGAVANLTIATGASLTNNGTLQISGTITNSGTFTSTAGVIDMNGSSAQTLAASTFATNTIKGLTVSNNVTLAGPLAITDLLSFGNFNSKTLASAGHLTLRSTALNTASIADMTNAGVNSGNSISGNVTVERYIAPNTGGSRTGRAWRILTAPVTGTTINAAWQEGMVFNGSVHKLTGTQTTTTPTAGYGTIITGHAPGTAVAANGAGFDFWSLVSNTVSSIRRYSITGASGNWSSSLGDTYSTAIDNQQAYLVFVRGNRTKMLTGDGTIATTLRATGAVKQGTQNITVPVAATAGYTLVGNPFAAPLDFEQVYNANNTAIKPRFWLWDANLNVSGGYRLNIRTGTNTYTTTPFNMGTAGSSTANTQYKLIESGTGFLVEPNVGGTLSIQEAHKASSNPSTTVFRTGNGSDEKLYINLNVGNNNNTFLADGIQARFGDNYSAGVTSEDIGKPTNFNESLSFLRSSRSLVVESRPLVVNSDTLFLNLSGTTIKGYQFQLKAENFSAPGLTAFVQDTYTAQQYPIDLFGGITTIDFAITAEAASKSAARFRVIFNPATTLPLHYTGIKATQHNNAIKIDWTIASNKDVKYFEVERSANALQFSKIGMVEAQHLSATTVYNYLDAQPTNGINYYRVRAISITGEITYSSVVKVNISSGQASMNVFPNPIIGTRFTLQLSNQPAGKYEIKLVDNEGKFMHAQSFIHTSGSAAQIIQLNHRLPAGIYHIQLITGGIQQSGIQVVNK